MKTQFLKSAQSAFLLDTLRHFNSGNRGVLPNATCQYFPGHKGTEGCAIGRHVPNKTLCAQFDWASNGAADSKEVFPHLPGQLQALGGEFLADVQSFHDTRGNWGPKGPSDRGLLVAHRIIQMYDLEGTEVDDVVTRAQKEANS